MLPRPFVISIKIDFNQPLVNYENCGSIFLRVYSRVQKKAIQIYLGEYCTHDEFENILSPRNTKSHLKDLELRLLSAKNRAERFNDFSKVKTLSQLKEHFKSKSTTNLLKDYYNEVQELKTRDNTRQQYINSYNAIDVYKENKGDKINVLDVNSKFIDDFKNFYKKRGARINTISNYLRPLRAVLNYAIDDPNCPITKDDSPFKKGHIQVEMVKKKVFSREELLKLNKYKPTSETKQRAHDWFWMSYYLGGINMNDLLRLKKSDIKGNEIYFYREKTVDNAVTVVKMKKEIIPEIENTFKKYKGRGSFHFNRLNSNMNDKEMVSEIKNFSKLINKGLKKIAKEIDINDAISFGWARHSYSTNLLRKGADKIKVSQSMGHTNPKTIENYWGGFEDEDMKKLQNEAKKI
jgi:integrase|tara:strand:+ start:202 stop:1422 length:1221 start_codon:yes stop_codon:yes gene_type:complete